MYNLEIWTNWKRKEWEELERIQANILEKLLDLPISTPYWGILNELGMWTMEARVVEKRMLLYHNIMNTKGKRICKEIVEEQRKLEVENGWYNQVKKESQKYGIEIDKIKIRSKLQWKRTVKRSIEKKIKEVSM